MAKKRAVAGQDAPAKKTATKKAAKAAKPATAKKAAKAATTSAAPKKKAAAAKLNDKQKDLLMKVKEAGETGFEPNKDEKRGVAGLHTRKLVKRSVDKSTKVARYMLTRVGEKALAAASAPPSA